MNARAIVIALLAVATAVAGVVVLRSGEDRYELRVQFPDAAGLRPGSLVKVGGVSVGSVGDVRVTPDDNALTMLELDPDAAPVGRDVQVVIRPANLLGEKFVDLEVGDRSRPLPSGARIPMQRTHTVVELDQMLEVLDPATRSRLGLLMRESGLSLAGRGDDVAASLRALPTSLYDARRLLAEVGADNRKLEGMLVHTDRVVGSVARERRSLGGLVSDASTLLGATAARRRELAGTVRATPGTLTQLRSTLRELDRAGAALRPAARGLRAMAPGLTATLRALPGFTDAAVPTLAKTRAVAPALATLGTRAAPVVRRLRPTAATLSAAAADSDALTVALDRSAADFLGTAEGWARAVSLRDAMGHVFRVSADISPGTRQQLEAYVLRGKRERDDASSVPRPAAPSPKPGLPNLPRPKPPKLPDVVPPALRDGVDRVTGLLDYLLEP